MLRSYLLTIYSVLKSLLEGNWIKETSIIIYEHCSSLSLETSDHWVIYALVEKGSIANTDAKTAVHHRKLGTSY